MITFYTKDEILELDKNFYKSLDYSESEIENCVYQDWNNHKCYYKTTDESTLQEESNFKEVIETHQERNGEKLYSLTNQNNELLKFLKVIQDHWYYEEVSICYVPNKMKLEIQFIKDGLKKETYNFDFKNFKQYYLILTAIFPYVAFSLF